MLNRETITQKYKFFERENELKELIESFRDIAHNPKRCTSYLIQGRRGIGKTRLVEEFITRIESDISILSDIPKFDAAKNIIIHDCIVSKNEPYQSFIFITKEILKQQKLLNIFYKIIQFVLAIFSINDVLGALKDLADSIQTGKKPESINKKEVVLFNKYRNLLIKITINSPVILFLQNASSIDQHSLRLIKKIIHTDHSMWGMIILEEDEDDLTYCKSIASFLNDSSDSRIKRIYLTPLSKYFPSELLRTRFGDFFIDEEENDFLYAISEGCPAIFIEVIDRCIKRKWIYENNSRWEKVSDFKEKIKPKYQKLLELIISTFQDAYFSEKEKTMIYSLASDWEIPKDTILKTLNMVQDIFNAGYRNLRKIGTGMVSKYAFFATDNKSNRYILEYLPNNKMKFNQYRRADLNNLNLLEIREYKVCENGSIICWDFSEGKRIIDVIKESHDIRVEKSVNMIKQVTNIISNLHYNKQTHGFIKPESIIESSEGKFLLATVDPTLYNDLSPKKFEDNKEAFYYKAPELFQNDTPNFKSDIYSLGVLFFHVLTDRYPFEGNTQIELYNAIKNNTIDWESSILAGISSNLQQILRRCLAFDPEFRFANAGELLSELKNLNLGSSKTPKPEGNVADPPAKKQPLHKTNYHIKAIAAILLISIIILLATYFISSPEKKKIATVKATIVVNVTMGEKSILNPNTLYPGQVQYLITDDILQSSDKIVMSENEFKRLYPENDSIMVCPELTMNCKINNKDLGYELSISFYQENEKINDTVFRFSEASTLLTKELTEISNLAFKYIGLNTRRLSTFTLDWDAYKNFYRGEKAWSKLDITNAKMSYESSLRIDPGFILAKLRLAELYNFEGDNFGAITLISEISDHLSLLSNVDSLKCVALKYRLKGDLRKSILVYRKIHELIPTRKEAAYEIAEAYFRLRDIDNAINYYHTALGSDPNFSLAINHLAYCYSHKGNHQEALQLFRKYLSIDSTANAFDSMGDGYACAGNLDSAEYAKKKGITKDSSLNYLYSTLAVIYIHKGQFRLANYYLDNYVRVSRNRDDARIEALLYRALISYYKKDYAKGILFCREALKIFDSDDLVYRNHEIHWINSLLNMKIGNYSMARNELKEMDRIIHQNRINNQNYHPIYKYKLHLDLIEAFNTHDNDRIKVILDEFRIIKDKIFDQGSCFNYSFFCNAIGELYLEKKAHDLKFAIDYFLKSLEFNKNYPFTLFNLYLTYNQTGDKNNSGKLWKRFKSIWKDADPELNQLFR